MPRVLIVSYHWLPTLHASARRVAALARHLPAAGWEPHILTRDWDDGAADAGAPQLTAADVAESASLRRAMQLPVVRSPISVEMGVLRRWRRALHEARPAGSRAANVLRWVGRRTLDALYPFYGAYPDNERDWADAAVEAGMGVVRKYGLSAVVSLGPPTSAHIVAGMIARRASLPWVVLVDQLAELYVDRAASHSVSHRLHGALARTWLRGAARAGAATPALSAYLHEQYGVSGETIIAPFDPDDRRVPPRREAGAPLRVVHIGPLDEAQHRVDILLDALDLLLEEEPARRDRLRVEVVASGNDDALARRAAGRPAAEVLAFSSVASIAEEPKRHREADVLLQFEEDDPGAPAVTSLRCAPRLFAMLHARRPIVAIVDALDGYVATVLAETRAGQAVDSPVALAGALRGMLQELAEGGEIAFGGDEQSTAPYSSPEQARRVALLLDAASAERFGSWQRA